MAGTRAVLGGRPVRVQASRTMIEFLTVAALALAWFTFRFDRYRRGRDAIEAAYSTLRAVHHAMVQGLTPGQAVGWGQLYFQQDYDEGSAQRRADGTAILVRNRQLDQVFVVPTEPLERLATSAPSVGLIEYKTVAVANHALWRLHRFNQLLQQLTDFNAAHAHEIAGDSIDQARRDELAEGAAALSYMLHLYGIGWAWSALPDGGRGWYGALVETIGGNMTKLDPTLPVSLRERLVDWPYSVGDLLVLGLLAAVIVRATC
jgi:hypothetical protein